MTTFITWDYFLAGEEDRARDLLRRELPAGQTLEKMTEMYMFILAYLRHKLLGMDTKAQMIYQRAQLVRWEDEARRHAHNPHGARLNEILPEIRALVQESTRNV